MTRQHPTRQHLITACILIAATALATLGIVLIQTPETPGVRASAPLDHPSSAPRSTAPESPESQRERSNDPDTSTDPDGGLNPAQAEQLTAVTRAFVTSYHRRTSDDAEATTWLSGAIENCTPEMAQELKTRFSSDGGLQWIRFVDGRSTTAANIRRTTVSHAENFAKGQATVIVDYTVSTHSDDPLMEAADTTYVRTVDLVRTEDGWKVSAMANLSGEPTA